MKKVPFFKLFRSLQFIVLILSFSKCLPMGGMKDEQKLFTSQPSYRVTVYFKDGSKKDLKSIHYNGKPELPNVYLVCRGIVDSVFKPGVSSIDEKSLHDNKNQASSKKRKTSIKATIAFKNIKEMVFEKFSDTHVKAHVISSRDGMSEEYRIPSDVKLKAESDISSVELDLTRIDKIVFTGIGTVRNVSTEAEEKARKEKLFRPAERKSLERMKQGFVKPDLEKFAVQEAAVEAKTEELLEANSTNSKKEDSVVKVLAKENILRAQAEALLAK